jgi:hypothetical protein
VCFGAPTTTTALSWKSILCFFAAAAAASANYFLSPAAASWEEAEERIWSSFFYCGAQLPQLDLLLESLSLVWQSSLILLSTVTNSLEVHPAPASWYY